MPDLLKNLPTIFCTTVLIAAGCAAQTTTVTQTQTRTLIPNQTITVGNTALRVQVVRTPQEQARGLSGIQELQTNEGMLFSSSPPFRPTFWMKGMLFPIDIIWIHNGKVVGVDENLQPPDAGQDDTALARYPSPTSVDSVLEVHAGWSAAHHVQEGDILKM